ncbi:MAG: hypothetical protein EOM14_05120 [Clostridia bacterium]|nr:hypothetical protein [Clostridia bacterium]
MVVGIAAHTLNNQAQGIDEPQPQTNHSTLLTAAIAQTAATPTDRLPRPTSKPDPTTMPEADPTSTVRIYGIPLTEELQTFTFYLCEDYGADYEMALALMDRESNYTASAISKTNDYGIMQINKINHKWLTEELGITDFLDPEQNIRCGVYMLAELAKKYDDPHRVLMAYNMGEKGAREYTAKGNTSSAYSRFIMEQRDKLLQEGGDE